MTLTGVTKVPTVKRNVTEYSYFRTNRYNGTLWAFESGVVQDRNLAVVLGSGTLHTPIPFEQFEDPLEEQAVPQLIKFFDDFGWEVVSYTGFMRRIAGKPETTIDISFVLKRK